MPVIILIFPLFPQLSAEEINPLGSNQLNETRKLQMKSSFVDALSLYNQGNFSEAIRQTTIEISQNFRNMDARIIQSWSLVALGRYEEAETLSIDSLKINPNDIRFIEILGEIYFYQKKLSLAFNQFSEYIKIAPSGIRIGRVYSFLGDMFLNQGKIFESEFSYTVATQTFPKSSSLWMKLGETRLRLKNDKSAQLAFEKVLEIDPKNSEAISYIQSLSKTKN